MGRVARTPLDDDTLLRCQQQLDALISDIDDLLADIAATSERDFDLLRRYKLNCEHCGGATYE
jgi:hypothetical protein